MAEELGKGFKGIGKGLFEIATGKAFEPKKKYTKKELKKLLETYAVIIQKDFVKHGLEGSVTIRFVSKDKRKGTLEGASK